jgi:hypothetical protein
MNTYNLITVEETTVTTNNIGSISTTSYLIPVDINDVPITDYITKNRVIKNNQMLVFDTEQEYRDWLQQNS